MKADCPCGRSHFCSLKAARIRESNRFPLGAAFSMATVPTISHKALPVQHSFLRSPLALIAAAAATVAAVPAIAAEKSVAVTAIVEHKALDAVRDGVKDELKAAGF